MAVALALLALAACGGGSPTAPASSPEPTAQPTVSLGGETLGDRLIAAIPVGRGPGGITSAFGSIWVENHRASSISRIDPATNRAVVEIPAGEHTCGVVAAEDGIWVPSFDGIRRIDPETNTVAATIETDSCAVALAEGRVWSVGAENVVRSFDPETHEAIDHLEVGAEGYLVAAEGSVWVMDRSPRLWVLDARTGQVTDEVPLGDGYVYWSDLLVAHGSVWISLGGVIQRRNLRTLKVEEEIDLGTHPLWLTPGEDSVWVTAAGDERILRMDPETLELSDELVVGDYASPFHEAFGDGWTGGLNHSAVYRVSLEPQA